MIEDHVAKILELLGLSLDAPDFVDTPRRVAAWLTDMTGYDPSAVAEILQPRFPAICQMVVVRDIEVASMCPHHLLPVEYTVTVGYLPAGEVVGLSKIPRLVEYVARQPILQEAFGELVAEALHDNLALEGCGVVVVGRHACMRCRGVRTGARVTTSALRGVFLESAVRSEFLTLGGVGG